MMVLSIFCKMIGKMQFQHLGEAALKKDGWGWAVNHGDIWLAEAVAIIFQGVENSSKSGNPEDLVWINEAEKLLEKAHTRANEAGVFDDEGHPWISEVISSLKGYKDLISNNNDITDWLSEFIIRTIFWCSQVLAGVAPFPPKCRERLADESTLIGKIPLQYNALALSVCIFRTLENQSSTTRI